MALAFRDLGPKPVCRALVIEPSVGPVLAADV
jgi:hypothetical protein